MTVNNPPLVSSIQPFLIASATAIDSNALATTTLTWATGMTAANTVPLFMRVSRVTGTMLLLIGTLNLNSVVMQTVAAAEAAALGASASALQYPISSVLSVVPVPTVGNYGFVVGTINGSASTITVQVYGWKIS